MIVASCPSHFKDEKTEAEGHSLHSNHFYKYFEPGFHPQGSRLRGKEGVAPVLKELAVPSQSVQECLLGARHLAEGTTARERIRWTQGGQCHEEAHMPSA